MISKDDIQEKVLKIILPLYRAGVALSGGTGKTLLGLKHMNANYYNDSNHSCKFLVVAPKLSIFESWKDDTKEFNLGHLTNHITFSTYLSLNKQELDYDIIYLDESHNLKYSHNEYLSKFKGKIIGLTGTPPTNSRSERGFMVEKYCPIVYSYMPDEAIDDSILNDYRIIVHYVDLDKERNIKVVKPNATWMTSEIQVYNYWTGRVDNSMGKSKQIAAIQRMKAMQGFLSKEVKAKYLLDSIGQHSKCLAFASTQEQAGRLCPITYHSNNKFSEQNLEKFKLGEIKKLVAVEQLSEGINIPNLKYGVIMHSFGNERKAAQKIFRFLRLAVDQIATVHILCYRDTVDEQWVKSALEQFNQDKITYI